MFAGPLDSTNASLVAAFGETLKKAEFSEQKIRDVISEGKPYLEQMNKLSVFLRRTEEASPINVFIRLFTLGVAVDQTSVEEAVAPLKIDDLIQLGVIQRMRHLISPRVRIGEYEEHLIAHDPEMTPDSPTDLVLGPTPSSQTVATVTVRRDVESALDVGTGGGVLAIALSRCAGRIVATDINERALNFGEFNTALNKVDNVEFRKGSFFEPAEGERFELVVANPPFVVSPDSAFIFRDSGFPADGVTEHVLKAAAAHLAEGAFGSVIGSWVHRTEEEDWSDPVRGWLIGAGCDAWILQVGTTDPTTYASNWNMPGHDEFEEVVERWVDYYRSEGIVAISAGCVVLRRRTTDSNWIRSDPMPKTTTDDLTGHITRVFDSETYVRSLRSDDEMLGHRFELAPGHGLEQRFLYSDGKYMPLEMKLHITEGMNFSGTVDNLTMKLLGRLNKGSVLKEAIAEVATEAGVGVEDITDSVVAMIRQLLALGFVTSRG